MANDAAVDATADSEYQRSAAGLWSRSSRSYERDARTADEKRRRAIIDAAIEGEAKAKTEFAAASRKIATAFRQPRASTAKNEYSAAKAEAAATFDSGQKKAAKEHAEKTEADRRLQPGSPTHSASGSLASPPITRKFRLDPEPPAPAPESYDKFNDPGDELFTRLARMEQPLKLLEGLIIPKSMKGAREAWIFIVLVVLMAGLALALDRRNCR